MTKLLGKAFEAASDLPAAEQDELAARILDEVAWERSSEAGASREKLRQMVEQARADIRGAACANFILKAYEVAGDGGLLAGLERLPVEVRSQAQRASQLFQADPFHPSLHFKRIDDEDNVWAVRVGLGYRALSLREAGRVTWFWIGSHSEYDKKV